jgi:hypothetical protein
MSLKLLPRDSHSRIYILGEFQSIWRPPSSWPNQLGFQSSSGAPHSVGNSDLRRLRGILEIQAHGLFLPLPDLYSWRVSENLEASFIRVKPARVSVIQWGTPFSGKFISTKIERDFGDSGTWVILTITRSINWHIYYGDWTLLIAGPSYCGFQPSIGAWDSSPGEFGIHICLY